MTAYIFFYTNSKGNVDVTRKLMKVVLGHDLSLNYPTSISSSHAYIDTLCCTTSHLTHEEA